MLSDQGTLLEPGICDEPVLSMGDQRLLHFVERSARETQNNIDIDLTSMSREVRSRAAVLLAFDESSPEQITQLRNLSQKEWRKLLRWLDISGLALYFLDRVIELRALHLLPRHILSRLQRSMQDNTARTEGMIAESIEIQTEFQRAHLKYAVLKGFSLWPRSVPKLELRHQFDLDFVIAEEGIRHARQILERRGYRLYAISGRSWEFKKDERADNSIEDLYKDSSGRSVELHVAATNATFRSDLDDGDYALDRRDFYGISMPVLSPVKLFIGQGLHAYKNICSEFSRTSHLLEFRRHVLSRFTDHAFWAELRSTAERDPGVYMGLGVVTLLITSVMGNFAPEEFTEWTVARLPRAARLWIKLHGRRAVFGNPPGNKLYLLLQRELEFSSLPAKRSIGQALVPRRLPPALVQARTGEAISRRVRRYRAQLSFIVERLHFHLWQGICYTWETYRWRYHMNRAPR